MRRKVGAGLVGVLGLVLAAGAQEPKAPAGGDKIDAVAQELVEAHNRERAEAKLPPLKPEARLMAAARQHARDMAEHDKMTHEGSDGSSPADRVKKAGYPYLGMGENVAAGQETPAEAMRTWMNSPPHKKNILGEFSEMGAARAEGDDGKPYWCVVFGRPLPQLKANDAAGEVVERLNRERAEAKLAPFRVDPQLEAAARRQAQQLAKRGSLGSEKGEDGRAALDRLSRTNRYRMLGESAASGVPTAREFVKSLMDSPGHKKNVLGKFNLIGVGYATAEDGTPYWTLIFGVGRS
jgi:uncharacterized protein YkwD